jgi:hypothetical protein
MGHPGIWALMQAQTQIPFGNDKPENRQRQRQTQIPFGNDKPKNRQQQRQAQTKGKR